jgi:hypothetical protein
MKLRLLMLLTLIALLIVTVRTPKSQADDPCSDCDNQLGFCMTACEQDYYWCLDSGMLPSSCENAELICEANCESSYTDCQIAYCGNGGGGGGGGNCHYGYSQNCIDFRKGERDTCLSEGSSGSYYQSCISNGGTQEQCCNGQLANDIQNYCYGCTIDMRNPDCVCSWSY